MVYDPPIETFISTNFDGNATLQTMTEALKQRIEVINAKNESTETLLTNITQNVQQINNLFQELVPSINVTELNDFKNILRGYINRVETAADTEEQLGNINKRLEELLAAVQQKVDEVRRQARQGGGRRTKKHKKSKSKGKGKGKAAKSKGRKTRRVRFGKAKKSGSRKHTSKRR